ncbi:MAG: hypothetical protein JSV52_06595 [Candidatus Zixiibacteriota bacterium]|nr:MAG: hypothetical protein JSV52_06595 [candidate division Zixibacteria bacterium]
MRWLLIRLLPAAVIVFGLGLPVSGEEFSFEYQKILEIDEPVELDLYSVKGDVTVTGGSDGRVIIEAIKKVRGSNRDEAEEVADHVEIKVKSDDRHVEIETHYLKMLNRGRSFWSRLLGTAGKDSYGAVDFQITVPINSSVSIVSMNGDVSISSVEGDVVVENSGGTTTGEYIFGSVALVQPTGQIDLHWIEGDIRVKSTSSAISIIQVRGAIDLSTSAGEVKVQTELDSPKDYFVETASGSITFSVPVSSSGLLDIETEAGEIRTQIPVTIKSVSGKRLVGQFGNGGPTISLSSGTGDVDVVLY